MRVIKNIIGSVFISIAALAFWVFILPGYEMQSHLKSLVEMRLSVLDSKTRLIQKASDINKEYQDKFSELKRLSLVVPSEKNIAEIITSIEDISSQGGINLVEFTVSEAQDTGKIKDYGALSLDVGFSGSYEAILGFLNNLEKHIRLIDIFSLSLSVEKDESVGSQVVLKGSIKASTYFLKQQIETKQTIRAITTDEN